jgi:peptidoglycan/LPS O-acetylase OafA/YrhL
LSVREKITIRVILHDGNPVSRGRPVGTGESHIPSLDGLRALSIVLVILGHAMPFGPYSFWVAVPLRHSDLGVRIFFVISGYLITTLLLNERAQFGKISLRLFYIRRALRILPAFFLYAGCVALLTAIGVITVPARYWVFALTYTVNFGQFDACWVFAHLWSLSVEEQFYLAWPLLMKIANLRTCAWIAVLSIFASPVFRAVHQAGGFELPVHAFPLACGPIAMGCLLALEPDRIRRWMVTSRLLSDRRIFFVAVLLVAVLDVIPNHFGAPTIFLGIFTNLLMTLCIARLIFIPRGLAARILNSPPVVMLGKLSYSLYLWQELFLRPENPPIRTPFPVNILLAIGCASISYWGLESRFLGLRRKYRRQKVESSPVVEFVEDGTSAAVGR